MYDFEALNLVLVGGALLFTLGCLGLFLRQSLLSKLLSGGLMGQAILITLAGFTQFHQIASGMVSGLLILLLLMAEGLVGLIFLLRLSAEETAWVNAEEPWSAEAASQETGPRPSAESSEHRTMTPPPQTEELS